MKYVLVHKEDYLNTGLVGEIEELERIARNRGLKLVRSFSAEGCPQEDIMCIQKSGPIDVYEVVVEPVEPQLKE